MNWLALEFASGISPLSMLIGVVGCIASLTSVIRHPVTVVVGNWLSRLAGIFLLLLTIPAVIHLGMVSGHAVEAVAALLLVAGKLLVGGLLVMTSLKKVIRHRRLQ